MFESPFIFPLKEASIFDRISLSSCFDFLIQRNGVCCGKCSAVSFITLILVCKPVQCLSWLPLLCLILSFDSKLPACVIHHLTFLVCTDFPLNPLLAVFPFVGTCLYITSFLFIGYPIIYYIVDIQKVNPHFKNIFHIANQNCICYNAFRQKATNSPCRTTKSPGVPAPGLFYSHFWQCRGLRP